MQYETAIYLAGKIQKTHEPSDESYWSPEDLEQIEQAFFPHTIHLLNPAIRSDDLSDQHSVFGRDMLQVFSADAVFVDARDRRGLGVGSEMMWAKMNRIPVITLSPLDTHYHRSSAIVLNKEVDEWIHPFIQGLSDVMVSSPAEGAMWLLDWKKGLSQKEIKGPEWIHDAMKYYLKTQYPTDLPMRDLMQSSEAMEKRLLKV